jgi:hypothetical protein
MNISHERMEFWTGVFAYFLMGAIVSKFVPTEWVSTTQTVFLASCVPFLLIWKWYVSKLYVSFNDRPAEGCNPGDTSSAAHFDQQSEVSEPDSDRLR